MPVRQYSPTSPGRRNASGYSFAEITKKEPEKSLTVALRKRGGRNDNGRITTRHRGGGAKRRYRIIDFKRSLQGVDGKVVAIEYDPNRPGNALPMDSIPVGTTIHAIELRPGQGAALVRSAGTAAQLMAKEGGYVTIRLPSGEMRRVLANCMAVIGQVGNVEHDQLRLGKAGRTRHLGRRPVVRGSAMTPRDHPHGGGEGKAPVGHPGPKTKWGRPAYGVKTRKPKKASDRLIVRRRETR